MKRAALCDLTAEHVRSILSYDKGTGLFRWKPNPSRPKEWNTRRAGKIAGGRNGGSTPEVIVIRIDDRLYLAHRLAWLWMTGEWPKDEIDHSNGHPGDNRWANLREATHAENLRNKSRQSNNTSGFVGVTYFPAMNSPWRARINVKGEQAWIGYFDSPQEADSARREQLARIHGEFAALPARHRSHYVTKKTSHPRTRGDVA